MDGYEQLRRARAIFRCRTRLSKRAALWSVGASRGLTIVLRGSAWRKRILIGVPLVGMASGRTRADARVLTQCVQKTIVARSFARYAAP